MNHSIGDAAGTVWRTLDQDGPLSITNLKSKTSLDPNTLFMAIGWLAREDKVTLNKTGKRKIEVALTR